MTDTPASAAQGDSGEAVPCAAESHGTWAAIKRHRNAHEPLCDACRTFHRDYYREYERTRRQFAAEKARKAVTQKRWRQRNRDVVNAYERRRYRLAAARAEHDRRHLVDDVAVERAIQGEDVRLNSAEKRVALHQLLDRGHTLAEAARRLRLNYTYARKYAGVA